MGDGQQTESSPMSVPGYVELFVLRFDDEGRARAISAALLHERVIARADLVDAPAELAPSGRGSAESAPVYATLVTSQESAERTIARARELARESGAEFVLVDRSPAFVTSGVMSWVRFSTSAPEPTEDAVTRDDNNEGDEERDEGEEECEEQEDVVTPQDFDSLRAEASRAWEEGRHEEALTHLEVAANAGDTKSMLTCGNVAYAQKQQVTALAWYRRAGLAGESEGWRKGATLLTRPEPEYAPQWWGVLAADADVEALQWLGMISLAQNRVYEGARWLRRAADAGSVPAATRLAELAEFRQPR